MLQYPFSNLSVLNIEITNLCNLSCLYCSRKDKVPTWMEEETFDRILELFNHKKEILVALYLGGEPTLHPGLCKFIQKTKKQGFMKTRIHTNGTHLDFEYTHDLIDSGLDSIIFSIDGVDAEDYKRIRGVPISHSLEALKYLLGYKNSKASDIEVGVQCLVGKGGFLELNEQLMGIKEQLDVLEVVRPHSWINSKIPDSIPIKKEPPPCMFLKSYMVVNVQGEYLLCCRCLNSEKVLGSIWETDPETIWNTKMEQFRLAQKEGLVDLDPCCLCDAYTGK